MTIEIRDLSVSIGSKPLLSGINFDCRPGEVVAIIGENGAGKSTLMNCISGNMPDYQGRVCINGVEAGTYSATELARIRAVLPQNSDLNFPLSVSEVVRLPMSLSALPLDQQNRTIHKCLQMVDATEFAERNYLTLSGGEKQRVQLARVLAQILSTADSANQTPRYLLLDEPTSALDLSHQYETLRLLRNLVEQQLGVVIIVHDLNTASLYCDKIVLLKNGTVAKQGTPSEVIQADVVNATFGIEVTVGTHPDMDRPYLIPRLNQAG